VSVTPFLWFDNNAAEFVSTYVELIPDSRVTGSLDSMVIEFELAGRPMMALNGGPHFSLNPAFSLFIDCADQAEVDHYWEALLDGGTAQQCGWVTDRFGVSWQVVPRQLGQLMSDPDQEKSARVFDAMMKMVKLDVAALEKAYAGD